MSHTTKATASIAQNEYNAVGENLQQQANQVSLLATAVGQDLPQLKPVTGVVSDLAQTGAHVASDTLHKADHTAKKVGKKVGKLLHL
jgi:hypothetical protein